MKKQGRIRLAVILAAAALLFGLLTPAVSAEEEAAVQNLVVSEEGLVTWDGVAADAQYWLGVDGTYLLVEEGALSADLRGRIGTPGVYSVTVEAYTADGSQQLAGTNCTVSFDGNTFAEGARSILAGWWDTANGDAIAEVTVNGTVIPPNGGLFLTAGETASVVIRPAAGYDCSGAFLRYDDENRFEFDSEKKEDGFWAGTVTVPDAVWKIGINSRSTLPSFGCSTADFGRRTEGAEWTENHINVGLVLGDQPLPAANEYLKVECTAGDAAAFAFAEINGGNWAEPFGRYDFRVFPDSSLTAGRYEATLTLYYDRTGSGADWTPVDTCMVSVEIAAPGTPVTAERWWCTTGDYVQSVALNGSDFGEPTAVVPGETASVRIVPREGYAIEAAYLLFPDSSIELLTVAANGEGAYEVSFTVPDSDFSIGVEVAADPGYVTISFDSAGGEGTMEPFPVKKDDTFTLPACIFTAPAGLEFDSWMIVDAGSGEICNQDVAGSRMSVDSDTVLKAVWKEENTLEVIFHSAGGDGDMASCYVLKGDYVLPEPDFTPPEGMMFDLWRVEIYEDAEWNMLGFYGAGETVEARGDALDLIAQWKEDDAVSEPVESAQTIGETSDETGKPVGGEDSDDPEPTPGRVSMPVWLLIVLIGLSVCAVLLGAAVFAFVIVRRKEKK